MTSVGDIRRLNRSFAFFKLVIRISMPRRLPTTTTAISRGSPTQTRMPLATRTIRWTGSRRPPINCRNDATCTFDALGRLTERTDRNGQVTTYGYDCLNGLTNVTFDEVNTAK